MCGGRVEAVLQQALENTLGEKIPRTHISGGFEPRPLVLLRATAATVTTGEPPRVSVPAQPSNQRSNAQVSHGFRRRSE